MNISRNYETRQKTQSQDPINISRKDYKRTKRVSISKVFPCTDGYIRTSEDEVEDNVGEDLINISSRISEETEEKLQQKVSSQDTEEEYIVQTKQKKTSAVIYDSDSSSDSDVPARKVSINRPNTLDEDQSCDDKHALCQSNAQEEHINIGSTDEHAVDASPKKENQEEVGQFANGSELQRQSLNSESNEFPQYIYHGEDHNPQLLSTQAGEVEEKLDRDLTNSSCTISEESEEKIQETVMSQDIEEEWIPQSKRKRTSAVIYDSDSGSDHDVRKVATKRRIIDEDGESCDVNSSLCLNNQEEKENIENTDDEAVRTNPKKQKLEKLQQLANKRKSQRQSSCREFYKVSDYLRDNARSENEDSDSMNSFIVDEEEEDTDEENNQEMYSERNIPQSSDKQMNISRNYETRQKTQSQDPINISRKDCKRTKRVSISKVFPCTDEYISTSEDEIEDNVGEDLINISSRISEETEEKLQQKVSSQDTEEEYIVQTKQKRTSAVIYDSSSDSDGPARKVSINRPNTLDEDQSCDDKHALCQSNAQEEHINIGSTDEHAVDASPKKENQEEVGQFANGSDLQRQSLNSESNEFPNDIYHGGDDIPRLSTLADEVEDQVGKDLTSSSISEESKEKLQETVMSQDVWEEYVPQSKGKRTSAVIYDSDSSSDSDIRKVSTKQHIVDKDGESCDANNLLCLNSQEEKENTENMDDEAVHTNPKKQRLEKLQQLANKRKSQRRSSYSESYEVSDYERLPLTPENTSENEDSDSMDSFIVENEGEDTDENNYRELFLKHNISQFACNDLYSHLQRVIKAFLINILDQKFLNNLYAGLREKQYAKDMLNSLYYLANRVIDPRLENISSCAWGKCYKESIDIYPDFCINPMHRRDQTCEACQRPRTCSSRVFLSGSSYCGKTLSSKEFPSDKQQEFKVGNVCVQRTRIYHQLKHYKYHLYESCKEYINEPREESVKDTVESCLSQMEEKGFIKKEVEQLRRYLDEADTFHQEVHY
ncbi:coiled-coil domain-containing protein 82 [Discoglossus pictus]